jgi:D-glycero-alpha-D-manno-heptose-7-phosphate kinase
MLIRSRAPLRIGLAGGGTDVSPYCDEFGGAVLNATIDYYAYASIESAQNDSVQIISSDRDQAAEYPAAVELPIDGTLDLLKNVHNFAVRKFNGNQHLSLRLTTSVDVPEGSGLGGSSTLVVAALRAYAEWMSYPLDDYELAQDAYFIEREEAGLHGGRQDQYAAAFGGFNFMEFGRNGSVLVNPLRIRESIVSELEASMLLFYTGASRASSAIIAEQSRNVETGNAEAVQAMHEVKKEALRMKEALLRGDFHLLREVLLSSWESKKRMASQIVNEKIERNRSQLHERRPLVDLSDLGVAIELSRPESPSQIPTRPRPPRPGLPRALPRATQSTCTSPPLCGIRVCASFNRAAL